MTWQDKKRWIDWWMPRLGVAASIAAIIAHAFWAHASGCKTDFARGGAAVVLIALAVFAPIQYFADADASVARLSGKLIAPLSMFDPFFAPPILAIVGTLLWGYGDLVAPFAQGVCR